MSRWTAELERFLDLWEGVDKDDLRRECLLSVQLHRQPLEARASLASAALEQRWYDSLAAGTPDYSVYDDPAYIAEVWTSWVLYSSGYIRSLEKLRNAGTLPDVRSVLDVGNGAGLTTRALASVWPGAFVSGTNTSVRQVVAAQRIGVRITPEQPSDVLFASEYFEHFLRPVEHLRELLSVVQPRIVITANSFGGDATGHFPVYEVNGALVTAPSRAFGREMRAQGFTKMRLGLWNDRPAIWARP